MPKADIHPKWYPEAKVFCNGEQVMTVGSTKPELNIDVWSGNHPFYTGTQKIIDTEGRVERFLRKYGMSTEGDAETTDAKAETKGDAKK
ncbi:MAG: 50S ribosomal protein L31 [Cyanobacteria bacterium J06598_3]